MNDPVCFLTFTVFVVLFVCHFCRLRHKNSAAWVITTFKTVKTLLTNAFNVKYAICTYIFRQSFKARYVVVSLTPNHVKISWTRNFTNYHILRWNKYLFFYYFKCRWTFWNLSYLTDEAIIVFYLQEIVIMIDFFTIKDVLTCPFKR